MGPKNAFSVGSSTAPFDAAASNKAGKQSSGSGSIAQYNFKSQKVNNEWNYCGKYYNYVSSILLNFI